MKTGQKTLIPGRYRAAHFVIFVTQEAEVGVRDGLGRIVRCVCVCGGGIEVVTESLLHSESTVIYTTAK